MFQALLQLFKFKKKECIAPVSDPTTPPPSLEIKEEVQVQASPESVNSQITDAVTQSAPALDNKKARKPRQTKKK